MKAAGEYHEELLQALNRQSWNVAIRRAQEVVELSLKGLLKILGVEFPRVHDVAPLLARSATEKGIKLDMALLKEVTEVSARLDKMRGPAFYMEESFTEGQAQEAQSGAEKVLAFARRLAEQWEKSTF